jgi:hypothetical protein
MDKMFADGRILLKLCPSLIDFYSEANFNFLYDEKNNSLIHKETEENNTFFLPIAKLFYSMKPNKVYNMFQIHIALEGKCVLVSCFYTNQTLSMNVIERNYDPSTVLAELEQTELIELPLDKSKGFVLHR